MYVTLPQCEIHHGFAIPWYMIHRGVAIPWYMIHRGVAIPWYMNHRGVAILRCILYTVEFNKCVSATPRC